MLRTYIFSEQHQNWIEEEQKLFLHDHCVILDDERKKIYLWSGPESTQETRENAQEAIKELVSRYPQGFLEYNVLQEKFPENVTKKVNSMLLGAKEEENKSKFQFSQLSAVRLYFISILLSIILSIVAQADLFFSLSWPLSGGNLTVNANTYLFWINFAYWMYVVIGGLYLFATLIGVWQKEYQVVIYSSVGVITCLGIVLYLAEGVFLFEFEPGSTLTVYLISLFNIILFLISILLPTLIFVIPNGLKLWKFFKTYQKFIVLENFQDLQEFDENKIKEMKSKKKFIKKLTLKKFREKKVSKSDSNLEKSELNAA